MNIAYDLRQRRALDWVRESLTDGLALGVSKSVAKSVNLDKARLRVFANEGLSEQALLEFAYGGKAAGEPRPDNWLKDCLNRLRSPGDGLFLFEDWRARPTDKVILEQKLPVVTSGQDVYYVLPNCDPHQVANWQRLCSNTVPLFHAFVVNMPSADIRAEYSTWPDQIASNVTHIILGVYDGESYLICSV
jgi:hypothetical protein